MKPIARLFSILGVLGLLLPLLAACGGAETTPTAGVTLATATTAPAGGAATATSGATGGEAATATTAPASGTATVTTGTTGGATTTTGTTGAATSPAGTTTGKPATTNVLLVHGGSAQATWLRDFNPFHNSPRYPTFNGIHEPLMIYNTLKGEIVPWLATAYQWSADNKTLTFTLRDGVLWSDGQPFSAGDVAFTFNLYRDKPGLAGPGLQGMSASSGYLDTVTATDTKTVVFTFKKVYTPGFYDIILQNIVPEHIWKDVADPVKYTNDNPVGTGPFTQVTVFEAQVYQVDKNPRYWQADKIQVNGLRYPAFPTAQAIQLGLANGQVEWAHAFVPSIQQTFVSKDPANRGYWFPAIGQMVMLDLNTTKKPFDDANVRKAISMAINRQQLVTVAEQGYTHPADVTGLTDAFPQWKVADPRTLGTWTNFDVAQANKMLDDAGLKKGADGIRTLADGTKMKYNLTNVGVFADWTAAAQIIVQNLQAVGIAATIQPFDFPGYLDKVQKGDFDLAMAFSAIGATPFNFYRGVLSAETSADLGKAAIQNYGRYVSAKGQDLLNQFSATTDAGQQKQLANQLQQLYADEAPTVPLWPQPAWFEYNTAHFTGWPTKDNPYAQGEHAGQLFPEQLIVYTMLRPK
jgi:peptide/nickel transport system substrate-binding protein